ncbi:MAG: nuclear transport factor 2 family protein [Pseudomonadales bacterium]
MMVTGMATGASAADNAATVARTVAIQQIEYLRRLYARATDQIGENTPASIAEGRATYHRIFTADVILRVRGEGIPASDTVGPDAWVDVVTGALASYAATQHLIGTQLVDIESIEIDASGNIVAGEATMSSYLQAWHASPDDNVWLFLGTYHDKVRYSSGFGWQIYDSTLERVSGEERPMGSAG